MKVDIRVPVGLPVRETADFIAGCEAAGFTGVGVHDHQHSGRDVFFDPGPGRRADLPANPVPCDLEPGYSASDGTGLAGPLAGGDCTRAGTPDRGPRLPRRQQYRPAPRHCGGHAPGRRYHSPPAAGRAGGIQRCRNPAAQFERPADASIHDRRRSTDGGVGR